MEQLLPLAFTMMIGPQIITSIILVTGKKVIKPSLSYVAGVAFAATTGTLFFYLIASLFNLTKSGTGEPSRLALIIQTALILLLVAATIRTYLKRATVQLPRWMGSLQSATPRQTFKVALKLIYMMPSDLMIMSTVGINLASNANYGVRLVPFIILTGLIAGLPLLAYLLFRKKAVVAMPKVRDWMENNSWVVSITAYLIFIWLLWPGG